MLIIAVLIKFTSDGSVIYWSQRVGRGNKIFLMPKFRTMMVKTPTVATHLLSNSDSYFTPLGSFLRQSSLDELPQIWSIAVGDMSFVGPRPALFNQQDLIILRTKKGIEQLLPGLTGWAQVNGRDELTNEKKVEFDFDYLSNKSIWFDIKILGLTLLKVIKGSGIAH